MSFLRQLFGLADPKAAAASRMFSQFPAEMSQPAKMTAADVVATRREVLRNVLRKTLNRHGIPGTWIGAEMLMATSRGREAGMHLRLLIKHWDPRLLTYAVSLQNSLIVRLLNYDPLAADWLMGISWQFALPDQVATPDMPHAGFWTAEPRAAAAPAEPAPAARAAGDVIAGPVRIGGTPTATRVPPDTRDSVKMDLDRLLAVRDAELKLAAERFGKPGLDATQPMYLNTEPQPLRGPAARVR